jgi:hypothetical protein
MLLLFEFLVAFVLRLTRNCFARNRRGCEYWVCGEIHGRNGYHAVRKHERTDLRSGTWLAPDEKGGGRDREDRKLR